MSLLKVRRLCAAGEFTWSDLIAGVSIVVGSAMVIFGDPVSKAIGWKMIGAGVSHFGATFAMYMNNKAAGWDNASNYIGFQSPTININTGWGDSKNDKNGVTQTAPVVKPETIAKDDVRNMRNDGGNKGDNSFHPGQYFPNFKADIGSDLFKFKGLHYGVPEFESSWMNGKGAITLGPFSLYPTRGSNDPNYSTHEPGHVLQFALMGGWYYPFIALPSIWNANDKNAGDGYTEKTANQLWYWWSGEKDSRNKRYRD